MKVYQTKEIRNITVIGNSGAGKTTLVESMLFEGGVISRRGDVKSKTTASDYNLVEQEYGNSVTPLFFTPNSKVARLISSTLPEWTTL